MNTMHDVMDLGTGTRTAFFLSIDFVLHQMCSLDN